MDSNKEQVRAHGFVARRLVTAVVTGRPDAAEPPLRRSSIGTVVGLLLAVVLLLGFTVFGLVRPAKGPVLAEGTTVVIEKGTGTRYLVDGGRLRPLANLTSALLAVGPGLAVQSLSRERTARLPRGAPVGIVGAPQDVPDASRMVSRGWSVCVRATTATTGVAPTLEIALGGARPPAVGPGGGLVVAAPDGTVHLVVDGVRHEVPKGAARGPLGAAATGPLQVPDAWLAALLPGRALTPLTVTGAGEPGPAVAGLRTTVGRLLAVRPASGEQRYYLVQRDGLVLVTDTERRMLLADPEVAAVNGPGGAAVVAETVVAEAVRADIPAARGWPSSLPRPVATTGADVCVAVDATGQRGVAVRAAAPDAGGEEPADVAVRVLVPPGSGALVETADAAGEGRGPVSLVDDLGRRFPVADAATLEALGLAGAPRLRVPAGVLAVVPRGVVLDVAAVRGQEAAQ